MAKRPAAKNPGGRPSEGRDGAKVRDYPHQLATRLHGDVFHTLDTIQNQTRKSYRTILERAIELYMEHEVDRPTRASVQSAVATAIRNCEKCQRSS